MWNIYMSNPGLALPALLGPGDLMPVDILNAAFGDLVWVSRQGFQGPDVCNGNSFISNFL